MWPTSNFKRAALLLGAIFFTAHANAASFLENLDAEIRAVYEKSKHAVVKVHAERLGEPMGYRVMAPHRVGTGFFISANELLTAQAVVGDAGECWIEWRGQRKSVKIVGADAATNVAVLEILRGDSETDGEILPLPLGNSDELSAGSLLIAIGFAYDFPSAPKIGTVGGHDISTGARLFLTRHIRAFLRLNPGESGAPLLNARGEVVGMAVAAHPDGVSYAIPVNAIKKIRSDIAQFGQARHGWIGLAVAEGGAATGNRITVRQILEETPAARAGFRTNDVLLRIGPKPVRGIGDVLDAAFWCREGEKLRFTVLRDGVETNLDLVVGLRPAEEAPALQKVVLPPEPMMQIVPAGGSK
jgi:serine protease Do